MLVISRYTRDGAYPAFAEKLKASCIRHGIACDVQEIPSPPPSAGRQGWLDVMHNVPHWLMQGLCARRGPVCWMDADCEVCEYPGLLLNATDADLAIYNWHADPQNINGVPQDPTKLLSSGGVIYVSYTAAALELLIRWVSNTSAHREKPCDQVLDIAFNGGRVPLRALWLPKSYNRMTTHFPDVKPVINHVYANGGHREVAIATPVVVDTAAAAQALAHKMGPQGGWTENAKPIGLTCNRCQKLTPYAVCKTETTPFGEVPICPECLAKRQPAAMPPALTGVKPKKPVNEQIADFVKQHAA